MNTLALALNTAIKSAVAAIDPLYNVHYVDYDSQFQGHRFCDVNEPAPNNPGTWFFNWKTTDDPSLQTAFEKLPAYQSSIAGGTANAFQTDEDYINALGDALGDDPDALSLLSDSVRIFHPTTLGHQTIRNVVEAALKEAGVPKPQAQAPPATATGAPPPKPTCNCNENGCTPDSLPCCANGTCPPGTPGT